MRRRRASALIVATLVASAFIGQPQPARAAESSARSAARGDASADAEPERCHSIRPSPARAARMMWAEGMGGESSGGPPLPQRSPTEIDRRNVAFWSSGALPEGVDSHGNALFRRRIDGAILVLIPGGRLESGVPDRHRDKVPPVVVTTACPAHIVKLAEGMTVQDPFLLREAYPQRVITLEAFALDRTEVTWARYKEYQSRVLHRKRPRQAAWAKDDHPVTGVTWAEAAGYCDWVGGRLPTDAEWELAARGPTGTAFPWGDAWPPPNGAANLHDAALARALCEPSTGLPDDGYVYTSPVGAFPAGASAFGILDMAGNASEWISDWSDDVDTTVAPLARRCPAVRRGVRERVQRGTSFWSETPSRMTGCAWERGGDDPTRRDLEVGFRCAHDAPPGD